jgi:hypothetical protein
MARLEEKESLGSRIEFGLKDFFVGQKDTIELRKQYV